MTGHGHVVPNADGRRFRCGGPGICTVCSKEAAADWQRMRTERDALRALLAEARPTMYPPEDADLVARIDAALREGRV